MKNSPGGSPSKNSAAIQGPHNKYTLYNTCSSAQAVSFRTSNVHSGYVC